MSYKDTGKTQVCPYNGFKECCYDACPFFKAKWYSWGGFDEFVCKKANADIETSKQTINNDIRVAAASCSSVF